jgi:uncharacterized membrane protein
MPGESKYNLGMKKYGWLSLGLILVMIIAGQGLKDSLPEVMASHWNFAGKADGMSSKLVSLWIIPGISLGIVGLFKIMSLVDPQLKKEGREEIEKLMLATTAFLGYIFGLSLIWNLGYGFEMFRAVLAGLAGLFWIIGDVVGKIGPNWTVGMRTPWTLSNSLVWEKTHKLSNKLFKMASALILLGIFLPAWGLGIMLAVVLLGIILIPSIYSWIEYGKLKQVGRK